MVTIPGLDMAVAIVRCEPSGREATVVRDTPLLDAIHQVHLSLGQSCDGVGLCGFCRVEVLAGLENLSEMGAEEGRVLASMHAGANERLACLARVRGSVTVTVDYWG